MLRRQLETRKDLKRRHKEVPSTMGASIDNKSTPTQESLPTFVICFPQDSSDLQYATAETYVFCAIKLARTRETSLRDIQQGKVQSSLFSYRLYLDTETWHAANVYIIASRECITKALIRLRGSVGWSVPLLCACYTVSFLATRPKVESIKH